MTEDEILTALASSLPVLVSALMESNYAAIATAMVAHARDIHADITAHRHIAEHVPAQARGVIAAIAKLGTH
jgi:Na+-driven multidrug efflux pump